MSGPHKRFLTWVTVCFAVTLLPIFILNMLLLDSTLGNTHKVLLASQWQQETRGVTYAPTLSDTHLFKTLRLNDRLHDIDTVILGSSTALGITAAMFPDELRAYNFAQTGHDLSSVIDEAEFLLRHQPSLKSLVIPLDWSISFIYQPDSPAEIDLSATANSGSAEPNPVPWLSRAADALSYPRIASLMDILNSSVHARHPWRTFAGYFNNGGGDDYTCPDGTPAKDFDIVHRGTCTGFRYDGSATFASSSRVNDARALIASATASNSKYYQNLTAQQGLPNAALLLRLADLADLARQHHVQLILFLPPLLPDMEQEFMRHPLLSPYLDNTKRTLNAWADDHHLFLFDAGQSERFSCSSDEFLDEHHAVASCYAKVFKALWQAYHVHQISSHIPK
jgi:hypothetical protein